MHDSFIHDVVVAGAGPTGLFLACELGSAGLSVLVLEQSADPDSSLKQRPLGLRGLTFPSIEALYRRGLLDEVAPRTARPPRGAGGHFAGIPFDTGLVDRMAWPDPPPGAGGYSLASDMARIEAVLGARAQALGVEIRRGAALERFDASADEVAVQAAGSLVRGRWLAGCDGGRSIVRKAGSFGFAGTAPEFTGYSIEAELAEPHGLVPGRQYTPAGVVLYQPPGTLALVEFDGGAGHRGQALTRGHVQAVLRRVTGIDVAVTALKLATTWTDRACQATAYRHGRVLLAGDAAHIHAPLGGQGLNLGLGDALNLGWKLAATVRGDAPDGLLDTYCLERHPVAAQVLDWSRAQAALMRPDAGTRALQAVVRDLIGTRDGATQVAERVWGLALRYDLGDAHPLVGRSAPDFALAGGTRLGEVLRGGSGVLVDFGADAALHALAACWGRRIAYAEGGTGAWPGLAAVLVRPDGIVAWAGDGVLDSSALTRAAVRWFGAPVR